MMKPLQDDANPMPRPPVKAEPPAKTLPLEAALSLGSADRHEAAVTSFDLGHMPEADLGVLPRRMGDYEMLEEIARGGMGIVYKAIHVDLHRLVALKMILRGDLAGRDSQERFHLEAAATAQLQHPGIVAIYETGTHQGQPFFSMEYVEGSSLARRVEDGPLPGTLAAHYLEKTARAVHYAHTRGILHRDLKPANVLLDEQDQPKVTDFGLAKVLESDSNQTRTGAVMGTPSYMAPEQALAQKDLGPTCDVYSLGAILFELLTGRPPFQGETPLATMALVTKQEPVPPRLLNPQVDRDLETICLKCLEKDPAQRYPSAESLADDLASYLEGKPITARRLGLAVRFVKWCRRNPTAAALLGVSATALLAAVAGELAFGVYQHQMAQQEHTLRKQAESAAQEARQARHLAELREEVARRMLYLGQYLLARQAWESANIERAEELLARWLPSGDKADLRGWEWFYLRALCRGLGTLHAHDRVSAVAYRPGGKLLATAGEDHTIKLWEVAGGRLVDTLKGHSEAIWSVAFSPNGHALASAGGKAGQPGEVILWDADTRHERLRLIGHGNVVSAVTFSPDGRYLATACWDKKVRLWEAGTGRLVRTLPDLSVPLWAVAFSSDSRFVAGAGGDFKPGQPGEVRVWETEAGTDHVSLPHEKGVKAVVFAPTGMHLITGGEDGIARLWNTDTGRVLHSYPGHTQEIATLSLNWDGRRLATGSLDRTVRLWDLVTGQTAFTFTGHTEPVKSVAFGPDGRQLASGSGDGSVRFWDSIAGPEARVLEGHEQPVRTLAFNGDGSRLASAGADGTLRIWEPRTGKAILVHKGASEVNAVAFSPEEGRLAAGCQDGGVRIYAARVGEPIDCRGHVGAVQAVAFSPDGKLLASAGEDQGIRLWDSGTGKEVGRLEGHSGAVLALAFSRDGKRLVSAGRDKSVRLWDPSGKVLVRTLIGHTGDVAAVAMSPDGARLASGSVDKTIRFWDPTTGKELFQFKGHSAQVNSVAFSPDGRRLASGSSDRTMRIWDTVTGQEILMLEGGPGPVRCVAFSPDRRCLAGAGPDRLVRIWEALDTTMAAPDPSPGASEDYQTPSGK